MKYKMICSNGEKYNPFGGYKVPKKIKKISLAIMKRFSINGICDGMYICNVIAEMNNIGDGMGCFNGDDIQNYEGTAMAIRSAYGANITDVDIQELIHIIKTIK